MVAVTSTMTVADYCHAMERNDITINKTYQRSDKIWPEPARSYLIETILRGLPIPKIYLFQKTDVKSKKTIEEIVDGQQRSSAILDFFQDKLKLSKNLQTEEFRGKKFSELEDQEKASFLSYGLTTDKLVGVTPDNVREIFRRMNSYTVPLNPEEQRHAVYQGKFKWFLDRIARRFDKQFVEIGLFSEKDIVRMADTKLLAEVCHAMLNGIQTTNKKKLDDLYSHYDREFAEERKFEHILIETLDTIFSWDAIKDTELVRAHVFYALTLATGHLKFKLGKILVSYPLARKVSVDAGSDLEILLELSAALEAGEIGGKYGAFVGAATEKTNVREQRVTRVKWCCDALRGTIPK